MLLSNNRNSFVLYDWLKGTGENVYYYSGIMTKEQICFLRPSVIISYNYSHIVKKEIIDMVHGKIINMHISFLPWNRGSDPNFWSFIDNTPKGVTIHLLDKGLDTGDIIEQKEVFFDEKKESFETTYARLNYEIIELLKSNWEQISKWTFKTYKQKGKGTYHTREELNVKFPTVDWKENISEFKRKHLR